MKLWKELEKIVLAHNEAPIIHSSKRHLGIMMTLAGYILYSLYTIFFQINETRNHSLHTPFSLFFQFSIMHFVMFLIYLVLCSAQGRKYFICSQLKYVLLRCALSIGTLFCYSISRVWTNNIDNSVLYSTDAFWLVFILYFLKIPLPKSTWIGVLLGTIGVISIYIFDFDSISDVFGGLLGTLSGFFLAIIIFVTRYIVRRDPPLRIGFYDSLLSFLIFSGLSIYFGLTTNLTIPTIPSISIMITSGCLWAIALFFFLESLYYTEDHLIGAIALFLPLNIEMFNWIINESIINFKNFTASLITGLGGLIVILSTYKHDKNKNIRIGNQLVLNELINDEDEINK